jgi:hypothetical protein
MAKKSTEIVPTMLRIREDLRKRLEREAKKKDHSLNAEMVDRLEQSFVDDEQNQREIAIIRMMMESDDISVDLMRKIVRELWKRRSWADTDVDPKDKETELNFLEYAKEKIPDDTPLFEPRENPTTPRKKSK